MSNLRNLIVFGGDSGGTPPEPPTLIEKSITANGVYTASDDNADGYSKVTATIPNTYTQSDEGKVVSNGALVAQTANVPVTANGTVDTTMISSVDVNVSTGGGASRSDVNFYDYDGTIVNSYSKSEFLALTEMPANPSHTGLTAQGWNWGLSDAKTYVSSYGKLDIGQTYITSDGATRLHIHLEDGRLSPVLGLCPSGTLTIDWGDGSATETMIGPNTSTIKYASHTYAQAGDYIISVMPSKGSIFKISPRDSVSAILSKSSNDSINDRKIYLSTLVEVNIGVGVTSINEYSFVYCASLKRITIPNTITSIYSYAFQYCYSLKQIILPNGITTIGNGIVRYCNALTQIIMSNSINRIDGSLAQQCYSLAQINLPSSVTLFGGYLFAECSSLAKITLPNNFNTIGSNMFERNNSLQQIVLPHNLTKINSSAFLNCCVLSYIIIPDTVTNIYASAFSGCVGLGYVKFTGSTPPTLSGSTVFYQLPTDCIIYAPALVLNLYMNGTNYPSKTTYKYVGYATYESGVTLPDKTTDETHTLTWYATVDDAIAETNPITVGNGNEVYARGVEP